MLVVKLCMLGQSELVRNLELGTLEKLDRIAWYQSITTLIAKCTINWSETKV